MFKKLHIKLTSYMGVILTIFLLFSAAGIFYFTKYVYDEQIYKLMSNEALKIQICENNVISVDDLFTARNYPFVKDKVVIFSGGGKVDSDYVSYDKHMNIIHQKENHAEIVKDIADLAAKAANERNDIFVRRDIGGMKYRIFTKYIDTDINTKIIQVYEDATGEKYFWSFLKAVLWLIGAVGIIFLLTISYIVTGKALKPVKQTWQKQKEFIADASHELRTPLTVIQTNLDVMMADEDSTVKENDIWLNNAYSETRVMAKLIDQLLTLAKIDANETSVEIMDISLSEIAENVVENMQLIAQNKNIELTTEIEDDVIIHGDYDKIRRLAVILVDNAIKYTEKGKVTVKVYSIKKQKYFSVKDTGIGISEEDIKRVFDRFYRSDKARNRQFGGTGLGLSIAKWIADSHKAIIDVESKIGEGSTFTVKFN